jgi:hypothetical protein
MHNESSIDRKYREYLFRYYFDNPVLRQTGLKTVWESPCPFCSHRRPTESKRKKKTGSLLWNAKSYSWIYGCHWYDCHHNGVSFPNLIKELNEELYRRYQLERYYAGKTGWQTNCPNPVDPLIPLPSNPQGKTSRSKNSRSTGSTGSNRPPGARQQPPRQDRKDQPQQGN